MGDGTRMTAIQSNQDERKQEKWILQEYDFYPEHIEREGKLIKLTCDRGRFVLKKTEQSNEQLSWLWTIFQHLKQNGFSAIIPFFVNKYGDPFVTMEGNRFYVLPWIEEKIEEKYRPNWEREVITLLARLHQESAKLKLDACPIRPLSLPIVTKRWRKRLNKLQEYKEELNRKETRDRFEQLFLARYEYVQQLGYRALAYLQKWQKKYPAYPLRHVLCHGLVNRLHVLHDQDGRCYLLNFEQANLDSPVRELALFYRRNLDLSSAQGLEIALACLASYEEVFPLTSAEKVLFSIFLLFPEHIFRQTERYMEGTPAHPPLKESIHFEKLIQSTLTTRQFIQKLLA